jgi:hypothetical protein
VKKIMERGGGRGNERGMEGYGGEGSSSNVKSVSLAKERNIHCAIQFDCKVQCGIYMDDSEIVCMRVLLTVKSVRRDWSANYKR